ncbi:MAG: transglycosylase SLT domain-containing protein [Candidatus Dormibacteraeota bacterium]|nr:transglycosylase SLT domain-containing protein [Candidatus Dormibacteraeota bacterium]MBV9525942.1 transglycosylase SLT domain-containing protein [Candidatus Dormibacteraeota bacterium]
MRFPKRTRGLALGAVTLVAGPVIAASLTSAQPAVTTVARSNSVTGAAVPAVRVIPLPHMLRARGPIPQPTPTPAPAPAPVKPRTHSVAAPGGIVDKNGVVGIILAAAARWGVSGTWMVSIARCESGLNPHAVNPRGPYLGLFQFLMSTFTHNGGTNIWDPADQANITAKMLAHGQAYQWSCA